MIKFYVALRTVSLYVADPADGLALVMSVETLCRICNTSKN